MSLMDNQFYRNIEPERFLKRIAKKAAKNKRRTALFILLSTIPFITAMEKMPPVSPTTMAAITTKLLTLFLQIFFQANIVIIISILSS